MTKEEKTKAEEIASITCRFYGESHDSYLECKTSALEMAEWKDEQFWSYQNIEQIIKTYKSFPDRSCPSELVKKTIEKLKPQE